MTEIIHALIRKVREAFEAGFLITVMGWEDHNHIPFTRNVPGKKVQFLPASENPPGNAGLVLFLASVSNKDLRRIRMAGKAVYPVALRPSHIKRALEACSDLMECSWRPASVAPATDLNSDQLAAAAAVVKTEEDTNITSTKENGTMSTPEQLERFKRAFLERVNKDGELGKKTLSALRQEIGIEEDAPTLVQAGWIVPKVRAGKTQVGCYTAGPQMGVSHSHVEPTDPLERAKYYISQEAALQDEKIQLEAALKEVNRKMARIAALQQHLDKIIEIVE